MESTPLALNSWDFLFFAAIQDKGVVQTVTCEIVWKISAATPPPSRLWDFFPVQDKGVVQKSELGKFVTLSVGEHPMKRLAPGIQVPLHATDYITTII